MALENPFSFDRQFIDPDGFEHTPDDACLRIGPDLPHNVLSLEEEAVSRRGSARFQKWLAGRRNQRMETAIDQRIPLVHGFLRHLITTGEADKQGVTFDRGTTFQPSKYGNGSVFRFEAEDVRYRRIHQRDLAISDGFSLSRHWKEQGEEVSGLVVLLSVAPDEKRLLWFAGSDGKIQTGETVPVHIKETNDIRVGFIRHEKSVSDLPLEEGYYGHTEEDRLAWINQITILRFIPDKPQRAKASSKIISLRRFVQRYVEH